MIVTIIPATFNEKSNIAPLVKKIMQTMKGVSYKYEILFTDDSSDNTPQEIKKYANKYPDVVKYMRGPGKGLSAAFIDGYKKAEGKYIVCMDADLQHPPKLIPKLIEKLQTNNQIAIASRYIKGGSNEGLGKLWSFYGIYRRLVSIGMSYFTRILFIPIRKTTDPMTGFFAFNKNLIEGKKLEAKGFKILVEILMRTKPEKVVEIPLRFQARALENSKATITQGLNYFKHLKQLFLELPEAARFFKFCLVGFLGVLVNLELLYILVEFFAVPGVVAYTFSILFTILLNYFLNSRFTYRDNRSQSRKESIRRLGYYYFFAGLTMFINLSIYHELVNNFHIHYILAALAGIIFTVFLNFFLVTKIIWKLPVEV